MIPKIGSIGKGLVSLRRRKSWKAVEPQELTSLPEDAKDDLFDPMGEDYIDTYHELLSSTPSWSLPASGEKTSAGTESSTEDESILSEALFDDRVKEIADRIKRFSGRKELDQMLYPDNCDHVAIKRRPESMLDTRTSSRHSRRERSESMLDTSTSSRHSQRQRSGSLLDISASSRQSQQFFDKVPDVRLVSHPRREQVAAKSGSFHSRSSTGAALREQQLKSWAEKMDTHPESSKPSPPPPKISRDNPPPPPPRRNRRSSQMYPPPPPPAPLSTGRRSSTVESTQLVSRKLSMSCAEFSRHKSTGVDMSIISDEQRPMKLEPSNHRPRQLSLSCSDANQKYSEPRGSRRPRKLSMSDRNISYVRPRSMRRVSFEDEIPKQMRMSYSGANVSDPDREPEERRPPNLPRQLSINTPYTALKRCSSIGESLSSSMPNVLSDSPVEPKMTRFRDDIDIATYQPSAQPSVDSKHTQMKLTSDIKMVDEADDKEADVQFDVPSNEEKTTEDSTEEKEKGILERLNVGKIPFIQKVRSDTSPSSPASKKKPSQPKYDKNGRCLKHPSMIIARKRPFGKGWDLIKNGCPRCNSMHSSDQELNCSSSNVAADYCISVDELLAPSGKKFDWRASASFASNTSTDSNDKRITGVDDFLATSKALRASTSLSEAASLAIARSNTTNPPSAGKSNANSGPQQLDESARSSGSAVVSKMPYKTPWGPEGWYSGEVDDSGIPNGNGRIRMKNGEQHSGQWTNGYSEQYLENQNRMKRGFGSNRSAWKENNRMTLQVPQEPPGHSARTIRPRC